MTRRRPDGPLFAVGASFVAWAGLAVHSYPGEPIATSALWFLGVPGVVLMLAAYLRGTRKGVV